MSNIKNQRPAPEGPFHRFDYVLNGLILPAIFRICGFPPSSVVKLNTVFKPREEYRVDSLLLIKQANPLQNYIAHIEIQTQSDKLMFIRQLEYLAAIYREHEMNIVQYVIYVGNRPPKMQTALKTEDMDFKFRLIYLKEIDAEPFLASSIPEEVMLALLCKFPEDQKAPVLIERIVQKIIALKANEPEVLENYFLQLTIISQLRNLQQEMRNQIKKVMPYSFYKPEKDPIYQEVKAKGIAEGIEQGIEQGIEKGFEKGTEKTLKQNIERLLVKKLLSEMQIADALEVPLKLVDSIRDALIESGRLKE